MDGGVNVILDQCFGNGARCNSLQAQVHLRDHALDKLRQGVCVFDAQQRLLLFNRCYSEMYRLRPEDLWIGMTLRDVTDLRYAAGTGPEMPREEYLAWRNRIQVAASVTETEVTLRNGHVHEIHQEPLPGGGWVATFDDITERRRSEQRIQHMAQHDALTGLANRALFTERLQEMAARLGRSEEAAAVLCLDLDHFKEVNDTLGHPAGDALLQQVAERLRQEVRQTDTLARLGGDEFAVILNNLQEPAEASSFAGRVICALSLPFDLETQMATIGVSIGIALCSGADAQTEPDHVLRCADMALYRAKAEGRNGYRFFQPGMDTQLQRRRSMERDLRRALAEKQFTLHYQPQFDLGTRRLTGVEALLRWQHPEQGMIVPDTFISLCEETGLILAVGEWVLRAACAQAVQWRGVRLAVNLSPMQLQWAGFVGLVEQVLRNTGFSPDLLELEITEGMLLQDTAQTLKALGDLRRLGVGVVLDDFGTGYSSLSYLRRFPFDKLKIDLGFVADVVEDAGTRAIVRAVTTLGQSLGMRVNAEGIETPEQLACLRALGCDEGQGFLLGYPVAPDRIRGLLTTVGDEPWQTASEPVS